MKKKTSLSAKLIAAFMAAILGSVLICALLTHSKVESVFSVIEEFAGVLPFDDHASPEVIKREFGLSKNAFKRAVGHLMKEGKVEIRDKRIYIKK